MRSGAAMIWDGQPSIVDVNGDLKLDLIGRNEDGHTTIVSPCQHDDARVCWESVTTTTFQLTSVVDPQLSVWKCSVDGRGKWESLAATSILCPLRQLVEPFSTYFTDVDGDCRADVVMTTNGACDNTGGDEPTLLEL